MTNRISRIIMNRLSERKQFTYVGMDVVYIYGGIAQLARVLGSYPIGRRFESHCRYQINKPYLPRWFYKRAFEPLIYGPVVKRLRHRPFTAVTRVRFSSGSPQSTCKQASAFFFVLRYRITENRTQSSIFRRFALAEPKGTYNRIFAQQIVKACLDYSRPGHHKKPSQKT